MKFMFKKNSMGVPIVIYVPEHESSFDPAIFVDGNEALYGVPLGMSITSAHKVNNVTSVWMREVDSILPLDDFDSCFYCETYSDFETILKPFVSRPPASIVNAFYALCIKEASFNSEKEALSSVECFKLAPLIYRKFKVALLNSRPTLGQWSSYFSAVEKCEDIPERLNLRLIASDVMKLLDEMAALCTYNEYVTACHIVIDSLEYLCLEKNLKTSKICYSKNHGRCVVSELDFE